MLANDDTIEDNPRPNEQNSLQIKIESPSVTAANKKSTAKMAEETSRAHDNLSPSRPPTLSENVRPSTGYTIKDSGVSPTKSKL